MWRRTRLPILRAGSRIREKDDQQAFSSQDLHLVADGLDADQPVVASAHWAVVDVDGILVFRLEMIAFHERRLASRRAVRDEEVLVIVVSLLEQDRRLVAACLGIVGHAAVVVERVGEGLAAEVDLPVEDRIHREREMDDVVVGLRIRILAVGATDEEAAVLVLVVLVALAGLGVVGHKINMVIGIVERDPFDAHAIVAVAEELDAAELVAGGEDQFAEVVVDDRASQDLHRFKVADHVVAPVVLQDMDLEIGLRETDVEVGMLDDEAHLLVALVGVDVGVAAHFGRDVAHRLDEREARGESDVVRLVLGIENRHVVAR